MKPDIKAARKALAEMFPDVPRNIPEDEFRDIILLDIATRQKVALKSFDLELQKYGKQQREQKLTLDRLMEAVNKLAELFKLVLDKKENTRV